ncbi:MAG: hypothetical protein IJ250_01280, partial [Bacteroidales bacterium]|nr:hypothetical protein [Bacteroidales bacterium]
LIFNFSIPNWEAANKKGVGEFAIVAKCLNGDILTKDTQKGQQHGDMFVKTEIVDGLKCKVFTGAATTLSGTSTSWTCDMYCEAKYNYIDIKYTQRYYNTKTKQYITGPFWHEKRIYAVEYKK